MAPVLRFIFIAILSFQACKKTGGVPVEPDTRENNPDLNPGTVTPVTDPPVANTIGFFLDDWAPKQFTPPEFSTASLSVGPVSATVTLDASSIITKIPLSVTAHNANTWMTPMVTEPLFMHHITQLHPHVIRWPAGSGSDLYFWNRAEGSPPDDAPAKIMNSDGALQDAGYWYGNINNNWSASLDQYYQMREQSGNEGIITVNYGYARYGTSANPVAAAAHLAADWVRYDNGRTKYWEIGNENYGDWEAGYRIDVSKNKDGQPEYLTGDLYGQHFKVFADSMRKAANEMGKTIYIGAVTYETPANESWQTNTVKTWNQTMIPSLNGANDFYIVHNYFTAFETNSSATEILNAARTVPQEMMQFVIADIQKYGGTVKPIALTEWNMFATGSKQQVSNISGLFALMVVGESVKNKFGLAARWDLLNGWNNGNDHGLFSDGNEPGIPKWTPRPSFYYLYFLQKLSGDRSIPANVTGSGNLKVYATTFSSGEISAALVNTGDQAQVAEIKYQNFIPGKRIYWYSLEGGNDNGEFSRKVIVNGTGTDLEAGGPEDYTNIKAKSALIENSIKLTIPARGAVILAMDKK